MLWSISIAVVVVDSIIVAIITCVRLRIEGLDLEEKYKQLVARFVKDMQFAQSEYNENKRNPPLARNLPPVSGKIAWSRQLYHKISVPMEMFQAIPDLMKLPEMSKAVKSYNRLARVLVEYEVVYLKVWNKQVDEAKANLNSPVIVRDPETEQLHVNLNPNIQQILRDIQVMSGMGVDVPTRGLVVYAQKYAILERFDAVSVSSIHMYYSVNVFILQQDLTNVTIKNLHVSRLNMQKTHGYL